MGAVVETEPIDRPAWLEWRRQGIGGSDIGAILGLSKWASPWSVWAEKCGLTDGQDETDEMTAGRWLELAIAPWFTERTGLHIVHAQARVHRTERPWQRVTIDGAAADGPNLERLADALGVVEIKTGERGNDWDEIPPIYQAQAQWQMATTDLPHCWIPMLHGRRLTIYELRRDQADIDFMIDAAGRFWNDHVLAGVPPEVDGSDATLAALAQVWPGHVPGSSVNIDHLADVVAELDAAKAAEKAAAERASAAKARIVEAMEDAETGLIDGQPALTLKAQTRTAIDTARLRQAMPDVYDELATTTRYRVLRPKKPTTKKEAA